ncbi:MAG: glycosyltransferase family 2 protein [Candidatus Zambryskibacteria bacterium]
MKISFVVPAYNEEKNIKKCLDSILLEIERSGLGQESEIVVVNNASTDKTGEILSSIRGIKVVDEPKKGLVWARRAGLLNSCGELVANVDSDTLMPKGWLKKVVSEFDKNSKLLALSGPFIYYDLSFWSNLAVKIWYIIGFLLNMINNLLGISSMLQGGNFIVRRSALEKIGGYDTSIEFYGEDTDIARRVRKIGKVKWTFSLPMYTSGRRIKGEGFVNVAFKYAINFLWTAFKGRPITQKHKDIRF